MRHALGLLLAYALGTAFPAEGSAQYEDLVVDALHLDVALDHEERRLNGIATLRIRNAGEGPLERIPFLLGRLMKIETLSGAEATTTTEALRDAPKRGSSLDFSQDVVRFPDWEELQVLEAWVELGTPLAPGDNIDVTIAYRGTIVGYTESGMRYVRDRIDPEFTLIRSDAFSFPTIGMASLTSLRRQRRQDFTFSGTVRVDDDNLVVASAGHLSVERHPAGGSVWHFASRAPAPFLLLAVAEYGILETDDAKIYHFPTDRDGAVQLAAALEDATRLYEDWFGPRSDPRSIVIMEIPEGWGSQASLTGGIIQTADAFRAGDQLQQMYHEVAHLWHPAEAERPSDRWNEGFATFLQWRVVHDGDPAGLADRMAQISERVLSGGVGELPPMDQYGELDRTGLAYRIGPLFFYLLYTVVGAEAFDQCLGSFFSEHEAKGYTTADFVESVPSCGPGASRILGEWFTSTMGLHRLDSGASMEELVRLYRNPG